MEEWKEYKLGDCVEAVIDNRGKSTPTKPLGEFPLLEINSIGGYYPNYSVIRKYVDKVTYNTWFRSGHPICGDILIPTVGTIGIISIMDNHKACIAQNLIALRTKKEISNIFIYYFLKSPIVKKQLINLDIGGVQPSIKVPHLLNLSISLPEKDIQHKIASILSSLDDKIELNRKINANLEAQAQALFKSWFVDFEPFKDQPFVESELGMIPEGWKVGRYDEIIDSTISGDWGKEKPEGNYTHKVACIRGCDFQDIKNGLRGKTPERYILEKNFQTKHFRDKDILVEISGGTATVSTGRVCPVSQLLIDKFNEDIVCTNFCRLVRPKPNYGAFLYYSWLYKYDNKVMFGYENGTSGIKNFRIKDFTALEPVVIPSEDALMAFQIVIDKLQMKLQMNGSESQKLASLRDALLPRLMSGELKVNEVI